MTGKRLGWSPLVSAQRRWPDGARAGSPLAREFLRYVRLRATCPHNQKEWWP